MATHGPQEVFGFSKPIMFVDCQQADVDKLGRGGHFVDVFTNPVEGVEVAQSALAILDIGFDHISTVPHAPVPIIAFNHF